MKTTFIFRRGEKLNLWSFTVKRKFLKAVVQFEIKGKRKTVHAKAQRRKEEA